MAKYNSLKSQKGKLIEKLQIRLKFNNSNAEYDEDLLGLYIDTAVDAIRPWRKLKNDDEFLDGLYDNEIMDFVVESLVVNGNEGQSSDSSSGITRTFYGDPLSNLKSRIPQRLG